MTERIFEELDQLLAEEREAIGRLDGGRVLQLGLRKQALVAELCRSRDTLPPESVLRLKALIPRLRQNGILLAHARNVLRDAVAVVWRATKPTALPLNASPRGSTLSVRG